MLTARRLSLAVQMVLASSAALACGGGTGSPSVITGSSYCKTAAANAASNECAPTCSAETMALVPEKTLCDAEKTFFALSASEHLKTYDSFSLDVTTPNGTTYCELVCNGSVAECELVVPQADVFRAAHPTPLTAPDGSCPFAAKVGDQQVYCDRISRPTSMSNGDACVIEGRRPAGWNAGQRSTGPSAAGRYLASCAELEAVSVFAFRELRDELASHGAPQDLLDACARAEGDEVVHAELVGELARRLGGDPRVVVREPRAERRALVDIAIENAVEGCVRELFGAAQALFRAARARSEEVRAVMRRVAEDEARHADLSLTIGAYLATRLDAAERSRVRLAEDAARTELRRALAERERDADASLEDLGVPTRDEALALYDALDTAFWRAAA